MGKGLDRKKAKKEQVGGSSHVGAQRMYVCSSRLVLLQEVVVVAHLTLLATAVRPPPHFLSSLSHD